MNKFILIFVYLFVFSEFAYSQNFFAAVRTEYFEVEDERGSLKTCHQDSNKECSVYEQLKFSPYFKLETSPIYIFDSNFAFSI